MKILLVRDRNVLNTNWLVFYANLLSSSGYEVVIGCDTYNKLGKLATGSSLSSNVKLVNLNAPSNSFLYNIF